MNGPPSVHHGGFVVDHYRGLADSLAARLLPLSQEPYEPTEFLFGFLPLRNPVLPYLFFQFPVLDVKGNNIPGVAHFAAVVRAPIRGTIVTPVSRYLSWSALTNPEKPPRDIFDVYKRAWDVVKKKIDWSPLLESLNSDKAARKASDPSWRLATIGRFEVTAGRGPLGVNQLAPYRGRTILTMQRVPTRKAQPNKPLYDLRGSLDDFYTIALHILRNPEKGEDVGQQVVTRSNAAMMDMVFGHVNGASAATLPPPPPP